MFISLYMLSETEEKRERESAKYVSIIASNFLKSTRERAFVTDGVPKQSNS